MLSAVETEMRTETIDNEKQKIIEKGNHGALL